MEPKNQNLNKNTIFFQTPLGRKIAISADAAAKAMPPPLWKMAEEWNQENMATYQAASNKMIYR